MEFLYSFIQIIFIEQQIFNLTFALVLSSSEKYHEFSFFLFFYFGTFLISFQRFKFYRHQTNRKLLSYLQKCKEQTGFIFPSKQKLRKTNRRYNNVNKLFKKNNLSFVCKRSFWLKLIKKKKNFNLKETL